MHSSTQTNGAQSYSAVVWSMCTLKWFNKDQMLNLDWCMCAIRILENVIWKWTGIIQARLNNADSWSREERYEQRWSETEKENGKVSEAATIETEELEKGRERTSLWKGQMAEDISLLSGVSATNDICYTYLQLRGLFCVHSLSLFMSLFSSRSLLHRRVWKAGCLIYKHPVKERIKVKNCATELGMLGKVSHMQKQFSAE